PTVSQRPPWAKNRISGTPSSSAVPAWLIAVASREGRRSSGKLLYMSFRSQAKRVTGLLEVITQTTAGEWWLSLENPAQNQSASCTALAPAIQLGARAKHTSVVQ